MEKRKLPATSAINQPSKKQKLASKEPNTNHKSGSKTGSKNAWWFSKKVKKHENEQDVGCKESKTLNTAKVPKTKKSVGGEIKVSKKKALQLKKKRQRKTRLLKKKMKSSENTAGNISRDLDNPKVSMVSGKKVIHAEKVGKDTGKSKKDSKKSEQGIVKSTPEISQSVNLQKSGGKKRKRKKAKKFKNVKTTKEVVPGKMNETRTNGKSTVLTLEDNGDKSTKKARQEPSDDQNHIEVKDDSINKKVSGHDNIEELVSSNWKALLPMVEKSKKTRKRMKDGKTKDNPKPSKPDIWFDNVDPSLIKANENAETDDEVQSETDYNPLLRKDAQDCLTKCLAMDCEMVGTGLKGSKSILARVSIVNQYGYCVCDKYITPREPVTDYRTFVSGIRPQDLKTKGEPFEKVQKEVSDLLKGRIVVGHALQNDFKVLFFSHPRRLVRDTSTYQPFKDLFKSKRPGLKKLTELVLKVKVQKGEHNSVEDAQAAMKLYMLHRKQWERSLREKTLSSAKVTSKKTKKTPTEHLD